MATDQARPGATICSGIRADGARCTAPARPGEPWCLGHSPDLAERRAEGRRRGGRNRSNLARAARAATASPQVAALLAKLETALDDTLSGDLPAASASAAASLARSIIAVLESADADARLEQLERLAQQQAAS